jgi:hypothetical protein
LNSLRHFQRIRFQQRRVIVNPPIVLLICVSQISPPQLSVWQLLGELLLEERLALINSVIPAKISWDGRKCLFAIGHSAAAIARLTRR